MNLSNSVALWDWCSFAYNNTIKYSVAHQRQFADVYDALELSGNQKILDAGCGTGDLEVFLCSKRKDVFVEAIDFSPKMLKRAVKRCENFTRVSFRLSNVEDKLPFAEGEFDAVVCVNMLFATRNPRSVLDEFFRLLKKGGKLVIADPKPSANMGKTLITYISELRNRYSLQSKLLHILKAFIFLPFAMIVLILNLVMDLWVKQGNYHFFSGNDFLEALESIGFSKVVISETLSKQDWLVIAKK